MAAARDAYAIWVSEIMLQQTTVAAVVPYFERFLERFPTVDALAQAPLERVLESWAGLGYYRRARHLHACARAVVERGGRFPETVDELLELPGIGPYTAGAIASIAFDRKAPLVDGNVARVLARIFRVEGDPKTGAARARLWEIAGELVPERGASVHNQALMELGALVCLPGPQARCGECPVAERCAARASGEVARFPELAPRAKARARRDLALAFLRDGKLLLGRRRDDEVWGGLWEMPRVTLLEGESDGDGARRLGREVLGAGAKLGGDEALARVSHTVNGAAFRAAFSQGVTAAKAAAFVMTVVSVFAPGSSRVSGALPTACRSLARPLPLRAARWSAVEFVGRREPARLGSGHVEDAVALRALVVGELQEFVGQ